MQALTDSAIARLVFELTWNGDGVRHTVRRHAERASLWRDIFPGRLDAALIGCGAGAQVAERFVPGSLIPAFAAQRVVTLAERDWDQALISGMTVMATPGRYYPQGVLWRAGLGGIYKQSRDPVRVVAIGNGTITVDLNHPLAGRPLAVSVAVEEVLADRQGDQGGRLNDWPALLTSGPGIEARREGGRPDFLAGDALTPIDCGDDAIFYAVDRMVGHVDRVAARELARLHGGLVGDGMAVLDLMSSLETHLPAAARPGAVTGLGMNANELAANPRLSERLVHDLNRDPRLPFGAERFDVVMCALSIEYLRHPLAVAGEVARVLRPGGRFVVSWSQRWFPSKAVRIWTDLHPFERVAFVLDLLERSGRFRALESFSVHGLARPDDDPHVGADPMSDPIFAVWGERA
jgi:SAM-dependent methyltransferase